MKRMNAMVVGLLLCCGLSLGWQAAPTAAPAGQTLKVGDKAPPLVIDKWVKGPEVKAFEKGKTYVVEFWATWCGPCIASMPHLSELQSEYGKKGVTIIGVTSGDERNTLEAVEQMVKEKGDGMNYTVAFDKGKTTNESYMKASGQMGIPTSFLVDQNGTIVWIGHPMFLDMPLELVVSGKWDPKTSPELIDKAQTAASEVFMKMASDPKEALAAFDKLEKDYPVIARQLSDYKFNLFLAAKDYDRAYKFGAELVEKAIRNKDAMKLNDIAWTIVDPDGTVEKKDLDLAMKAAVKADEFSGNKDAAIIDTLARVHFLKGNVAKAIELQTKAVELAPAGMKGELQAALTEYKQKAEKGN